MEIKKKYREKAYRRFNSKVNIADIYSCWEWNSSTDKSGYGTFWMDGVCVRAHRFSWEAFNGPVPDGLCVLHKCDNPSCVNPDHLFLGTSSDNVADMDSKGRRNTGPLLKEGEKWLMRGLIEAGVSISFTSKIFMCSRRTVRRACGLDLMLCRE